MRVGDLGCPLMKKVDETLDRRAPVEQRRNSRIADYADYARDLSNSEEN